MWLSAIMLKIKPRWLKRLRQRQFWASLSPESVEQMDITINRRASGRITLRPRCPFCQGNDADMPCAYPGEDWPGCLRYDRLHGGADVDRT